MFLFISIFLLFTNEIINVYGFLHGKRLESDKFSYLIQFQTISACGGVLLAPDWVLTAAQCVMFKRSAIFVSLAGVNDSKIRPIGVKATYMHPNYNFYSEFQDYNHNIALLKLFESYECPKTNKLFEIVSPKLNDNYKYCMIFGWQSTSFSDSQVFFKPVQYMNILPNDWKICTYSQGIHGSISNRENIFCAMIENEERLKACAGNPGTPLICQNHSGKNILLGIASWTNFSLHCDGLPSYLSVAPFSDWIYELISNDNSRISNSTINHENRTKNMRGDLREFENIENSELEVFENLPNFVEHDEKPLRHIQEEYFFYYMSKSNFLNFDFEICIFIFFYNLMNIFFII